MSKYFLSEYFKSNDTPIEDVIEMGNAYFASGSSVLRPPCFVYCGSDEDLEDPHSSLNEFIKSNDIQPAELFNYVHHGDMKHYEVCDYALFDLDGDFSDQPMISFPSNREIRKEMAKIANQIAEFVEDSISRGDLTKDDYVYNIYQKVAVFAHKTAR